MVVVSGMESRNGVTAKQFRSCGAVDPDLQCTVCKDAWDDPVELRSCGHIFCARCAPEVGSACPACGSTATSRDTPNRILVNAVLEVEVECTHCQWKGTRETSRSHRCAAKASAVASASPTASAHSATGGLPVPVAADTANAKASQTSGGQSNGSSALPFARPAAPSAPTRAQTTLEMSTPSASLGPMNHYRMGSDVGHAFGTISHPSDFTGSSHAPTPNNVNVSGGEARGQLQTQRSNSEYIRGQQFPPNVISAPPPRPPTGAAAAYSSPDEKPWCRYNLSQVEYDQILSIFLHFDVDGSGLLTQRQMQQLMISLNYARDEVVIAHIFSEMDTRRRGKVSFDDLCVWLRSHRPDQQALFGLTTFEYNSAILQFRSHDTQQRGYLDFTQFCRMCIGSAYARDQREAEQLFTHCDPNRTGFVPLQQYLRCFKMLRERGKGNRSALQPSRPPSMLPGAGQTLNAMPSLSGSNSSLPRGGSARTTNGPNRLRYHTTPSTSVTNTPLPSIGPQSSSFRQQNSVGRAGSSTDVPDQAVPYDISGPRKKKEKCTMQ